MQYCWKSLYNTVGSHCIAKPRILEVIIVCWNSAKCFLSDLKVESEKKVPHHDTTAFSVQGVKNGEGVPFFKNEKRISDICDRNVL